MWVREWLKRRDTRGASALLLKELASEDIDEYKKCLRMSPEAFKKLLGMVSPTIMKQDTHMRESITKIKAGVNFVFSSHSKQL